ncbi:MAG TPA: prolipoprotein diacylglyceryl transferase [Anaerolineae bacterium]|nr:prolipoprotein diacylglyceryl transferase [Anaerolineae bacterium]HIQ06005.1 prolipoprotein diacylglyceryl transferase [Anaerolineae bacterium]
MFNPDPIAFQIGALQIRWYGLLIVTGAVLAAYIASREAARRGFDPDHVWNALVYVLITGIIGARVQYLIAASLESELMRQYYLSHPLAMIATWQGGLGIYGAVAGGILGLWVYARRAKLGFVTWLDIIVVGVPLAQAIGRWGNFFNQELYGYPTDVPWAIFIRPANRLPGFEQYERFHPTFLYESIWNLIVFAILMWLARRRSNRLLPGEVTGAYFILYSFGRFWIEFVRIGHSVALGLTMAQWLALTLIVVVGAALWIRRRHSSRMLTEAPPVATNSNNSPGDG